MIRLYATQFIIHSLIFVMVYFFLITIAECLHALVAYRCGDSTPKDLGRISLDPLAHVDLIGTLSLCLLGIGWSKRSAVNISNIRNPHRVIKLLAIFFAPLCIYFSGAVVAFVSLIKIFGYEILQASSDISLISQSNPDLSSLSIVFSMILLATVHVAIMLIAVRLIYSFLDFFMLKFFRYSTIDAFVFSFVSLLIAIKFINPLMQGISYVIGSLVYLII